MTAWPRRAFRAQSEVAEAEDDLGRSGVTTLLSGRASASLRLPGLPAAGCRDGWRGLVREAASSAGPQQRRAALREQ